MPNVQLSTFIKWQVDNVIGYLSDRTEGKEIITKIWCKLCAKHYERVFADDRIKGAAKNELKTYVEGTHFVTKHNVTRHLASKVRIIIYLKSNRPNIKACDINPNIYRPNPTHNPVSQHK